MIKDMLFFHAHGIHKHIMPSDAAFPSILYFSYYYTYIDSLLLVLGLGILLGALKWENKLLIGILLSAVTVINLSNAAHTDEGVRDTINQHWYDSEDKIIANSLAVQKIRSAARRNAPVYLSFPSGSKAMFERRQRSAFEPWVIDPLAEKEQLSPDFTHYASLLMVQYLKAIEEGKFIISLNNAPVGNNDKDGTELLRAKSLYDVVSGDNIDLKALTNFTGQAAPQSWEGKPIATVLDLSAVHGQKELVLFVKGGSQIILKNEHHSVSLRQAYGYSYQMFRVPLKPFLLERSPKITFAVVPATPISKGSVWGPFAR